MRCLVLTGTGRGFSAGQDLKDHVATLASDPAAVMSTVAEHFNPIATLLATMPKPVVAAVNGIAAGAGASLAMACDIRLVARSAGFNLAFANVALSCDTGSSWWLPRLVGVTKAKELLLLPRTVRAEEALADRPGDPARRRRRRWPPRRPRWPSSWPPDRRWPTPRSAGPSPTRSATTWPTRWRTRRG